MGQVFHKFSGTISDVKCRATVRSSRLNAATGFSLVEVLLIMVLLSSTILPFTLLLTQNSQHSKGMSVQSTRSTLLNQLKDEMDPARPDFVTRYSSASMQTGITESGQTIPYIRVANTTSSTAFDRVVNFYFYTNTTDAVSSPYLKTIQTLSTDEIRINCGNNATNPVVDSSLRQWGDDLAYSSANVQPGYEIATPSSATIANDIVNTSGNDDKIFQKYRYNGDGTGLRPITYTIPVTNGDYTVKLYFQADYSSPTYIYSYDIYLENTLVKSAYDVYTATGGLYRAHILCFDVAVSDGVLNLLMNRSNSASSYVAPTLTGIVVTKRTMK